MNTKQVGKKINAQLTVSLCLPIVNEDFFASLLSLDHKNHGLFVIRSKLELSVSDF